MDHVLCRINVLAFGMPGWQELLILSVFTLFPVGLVLLILYLTGVIGGKDKRE